MDHVLDIGDGVHIQMVRQDTPVLHIDIMASMGVLPWRDECFDLVVCKAHDVCTHDERVTFLRKVARVVCIGGHVFISLPVATVDIIDAEAMVNDVQHMSMVRILQAHASIHVMARRTG